MAAPAIPLYAADYGRSSAVGDWTDANWALDTGVPGAPTSVDNVIIGVANVGAGWVAPASVTLNTTVQITDVTLGDSSTAGDLTVNAGGGLTARNVYVNNGSLVVAGQWMSDYIGAQGSSAAVTLGGTQTTTQLYAADGSTVNVNSQLTTGFVSLNASTLNANAAVDASTGSIYADGGTINQNANIAASYLQLGSGSSTAFNRTSGTLDLDNLELYSGSSLTLGSGDDVSNGISVDGLSSLTVDTALTLNSLAIYGGTLNLNQNITTSSLSIVNSNTINRTGGAKFTADNLYLQDTTYSLDGTDAIGNSIQLYNSTLGIDTATSLVSGISALSGSTMNVNSQLTTGFVSLNASTLNVNAAVDASTGSIYADGGAINQNANIAASSLQLGGGSGTAFNRTSGTLDLDNLELYSGSSLALGSGDDVSNSVSVDGLSSLTVDTALTLNSLAINGGTLNLNQNVATSSLSIVNSNTINRTAGAKFTADNLYLQDTTYSLDGTDAIGNSIQLSNSTLGIDTATSLVSGISALSGSTVNVNSQLTTGFVSLNASTLNVNAAVDASTGSVYADGGAINQNANIAASSLQLGGGSTTVFNRTSGTLDLDSMNLYSASSLALGSGDTVSSVGLHGNSSLSFSQGVGQSDGLDLVSLVIDTGSMFTVNFDAFPSAGLDWGFRLGGDQQSLLQSYLADGRLMSTGTSATVFYNTAMYGDFTYYGSLAAVPEPSGAILIGVGLLPVLGRRRRRASR